jgi:hypothetical protein
VSEDGTPGVLPMLFPEMRARLREPDLDDFDVQETATRV